METPKLTRTHSREESIRRKCFWYSLVQKTSFAKVSGRRVRKEERNFLSRGVSGTIYKGHIKPNAVIDEEVQSVSKTIT